jgi:hypothetical protein
MAEAVEKVVWRDGMIGAVVATSRIWVAQETSGLGVLALVTPGSDRRLVREAAR